MSKIRALFATLGAAALIALAPTAAHAATYGGDIGNSSGSQGFVTIWESAGFNKVLYPGDSSYVYNGFYNDVQKFRIQYGYVGRSQYSGTSYPYKGGTTYYMSQNNLNLELYIKRG